jgi:hypothetical protein
MNVSADLIIDTDPLIENLTIRISRSMHEAFRAEASRLDLPVTSYIRMAAYNAIGLYHPEPEPKKWWFS